MKDNKIKVYDNINAQCCCLNLRKVARVITRFFDRSLESIDINSTQLSLLLTLVSTNGKTLTEIAKGLGMERTTLTRNLKPLERRGLITKISLPDKRSKAYALTKEGHIAIENGIPLHKKAQQHVVSSLGKANYEDLMKELSFMTAVATSAYQDLKDGTSGGGKWISDEFKTIPLVVIR